MKINNKENDLKKAKLKISNVNTNTKIYKSINLGEKIVKTEISPKGKRINNLSP